MRICDKCDGAGLINYEVDLFAKLVVETCWKCDGSGIIPHFKPDEKQMG